MDYVRSLVAFFKGPKEQRAEHARQAARRLKMQWVEHDDGQVPQVERVLVYGAPIDQVQIRKTPIINVLTGDYKGHPLVCCDVQVDAKVDPRGFRELTAIYAPLPFQAPLFSIYPLNAWTRPLEKRAVAVNQAFDKLYGLTLEIDGKEFAETFPTVRSWLESHPGWHLHFAEDCWLVAIRYPRPYLTPRFFDDFGGLVEAASRDVSG